MSELKLVTAFSRVSLPKKDSYRMTGELDNLGIKERQLYATLSQPFTLKQMTVKDKTNSSLDE